MKVYKDNQHSVTLHPFIWRGARRLMVCVGLYAALDPEGGGSRLRTEQDFWKEVPDCFAALGQAPVLDLCLPKPGAEVLVAGFCRAPGNRPVPAQEVSFRVGGARRSIAVFGDREHLPGGGATSPIPFTAMPLVWERAFGGPDFPANPAGRGLLKDNEPSNILPNLEDPDHLLLAPDDRPHPACPFPLDLAGPARRDLSGTYDQHWLDTRWPAYPDDCAPEFFYSAQSAQRLPGLTSFFRGDEDIEIIGMHHQYPHIRSRLPSARLRAFVLTAESFTPFAAPPTPEGEGGKTRLPYAKDLDGPGLFREVELRCDTVWLLPDLMGAFVIYRGLLPVEDDEMDDVLRVLVVTEKPAEMPQSLEYYREELKKRVWPAVEIDLTPFIEAQAKTTKAVKMARDVPKLFSKVKKDFLGQSPIMPLSLGDMGHSARKTIATGRTTLDTLEKQMLAQREQFSHLMSFDLSMFPRMRATLDAQEKNLEQVLARGERAIGRAERQTKKAAGDLRERMVSNLNALKKTELPKGRTVEPHLEMDSRELLDKLDAFSPEGMLCEPESLNPWHDRGFPLLIAARRALRRNDHLLARLADWGLEPGSLENAWIGYAAEEIADKPELWGLPPDPAAPERPLPAGLYVPRFEGRALAALAVYPLEEAAGGELRGLGEDNAAIVLAPGSDEKALSLPAAHPGGAVVVAPEFLSALFAEQEIGDFCHIVAAPDPAVLAATEDLPPLLSDAPPGTSPKTPTDQDGLPLLVILPPAPLGQTHFKAWQAARPGAIPLCLPEGCSHVLTLAQKGHSLRRLVLDALPPDLAQVHDFDFPLPPKDKPPEPFSLNLPLPTKEELQGRIEALIKDIRSHFPDPEKLLAGERAKALNQVRAAMQRANAPQEAVAKFEAAAAAAASRPLQESMSVAQMMETALAAIAGMKTGLPSALAPEERAKITSKLDKSAATMRALGEKLAPLDKLREEAMLKLEAVKKGDLPENVKAAFAEKGMDPNAMKPLSREEVIVILAGDKNLERRNLAGLDLSGLDFSGVSLAHALCSKTNFQDCLMDGADFTFTIANEANFTGASFRQANFKQTVLQKAILRRTDFSAARLELTTLGECDCSEAVFDGADIKLCNFTKASLDGARFTQSLLSLSAFSEITAFGADFSRVRAFKCLFQKADLSGANFREAVLNECLFQSTLAAGISLAGAELRKFYTDADTDLSGADFSGADLREASLRMSRFRNADFYKATLENALIVQCDLWGARLDGLNATGCRFIKCDLTGADLSGTQLVNGALRKCRVNAADLAGANLYAANLCNMVINADTIIEGANFKRTRLAGKEESLRDVARRDS